MSNQKTVKDIFNAIVKYITHNSTFESNEAINESIKKIQGSTNIEDIFRIPINDRLYNFTNALQWLYFICFIIHVIKDENIAVPSTFNTSFSLESAVIYLSNKYNAANETFYKDYFDESDDE